MMNTNRAQQVTHSLLRIAAGLFFLMHGGQKLLGWFGGMGGQGAVAPLATLPGIAGALELFGLGLDGRAFAANFNSTDFWAQGFNVGVEYRW